MMRCTESGSFHSRLKCRDHSCLQRGREESSQQPSRSTKFEAFRQLLFLFCALSLFARKVSHKSTGAGTDNQRHTGVVDRSRHHVGSLFA
jgi:hypothetical protein